MPRQSETNHRLWPWPGAKIHDETGGYASTNTPMLEWASLPEAMHSGGLLYGVCDGLLLRQLQVFHEHRQV